MFTKDEHKYLEAVTYADREHRAHFVHGVAVCPSTDVWVLRFGVFHTELSGDVLGECLHPPGTAPDTHKLKTRIYK